MRAVRWAGVAVVVALAVCGGLGAAWAGSVQSATLPEGQLWAERPVLPWDERPVAAGEWAGRLDAKLDFSRRGKAGETRRYRIHRENVMYDRIGRPVNRMIADGVIERTLLREVEPGWWVERLTWTHFAAQQVGANEVPRPQEVPGAAGLSYEFSPKAFDYLNIGADFSRVEDPVAAYLVKVVAMDFSGFDALLAALHSSNDVVQIGTTKIEPRWQQGAEITQATAKDTAGQYRLGEMTISVAGVTRRNGEPCALVWFAAEGNDVSHDFSAGPMAMSFQGTEYFWGEMAISLKDGRVVGGELRGPLPWVMKMGMGGQPAQEMPVAGVIQQVSLWEVPVETAK